LKARADEAEAGVAAMREALSAAREILSRNTDAHYGHFHGGDPRSFFPDAECCTPDEMAAHRAACEAANRGEPSAAVPHRHDIEVLERDGEQVVGVASHPGSFGLGTTTMSDPEIQQALDKIDAALTTNAGAAFLARLHAAEAERGLAIGQRDAARANLAQREARLDNQNAGLVAMAQQRDEARREVEKDSELRAELTACVWRLRADVGRLKAENAAYVRRIAAVGDVLSANGCNCECGCDGTGHFDECDTCLACNVNEAITDT